MSVQNSSKSGSTVLGVSPLVFPLDSFYLNAGKELPQIEEVTREEIPEPYRELLVHSSDMTSTLEGFHQDKISIVPSSSEQRGNFYFRQVTLVLQKNQMPVEFGAIRIDLSTVNQTTQRLILEAKKPLGGILSEQNVQFSSRPKVYIKMNSDETIGGLLKTAPGTTLYGRRNSLFNNKEEVIAEIVELLPPA